MTKPNIVFIVAHPDDVAFSAGGTAWLLKESYALHVICASRGERGYSQEERQRFVGMPPPSPEIAAVRSAEEAAACELLGAKLHFLDLPDGEIFATPEACQRVVTLLQAIQPRAVFSHGPFEKADHSAVFQIAYKALHLAGLFWTCDMCLFYQPGETFSRHLAPILLDITPVAEAKRQLIECHASHMRGDYSADMLLARNQDLGKLCFCDYAEGFTSPIPMANRRWDRPAECGRFLLDLGG